MDRKIRVCHLTSAHKSNDIRIFQKECTSLAKEEEFEVYLVAQGKSREENGVKVVGIGEAQKGRLNRILQVSNHIFKEAAALNADIYHFHDPELLLYARRLKKQGSAVIFDSHEDYPKQIAEKPYLPGPVRKIVAAVYKIYETHVVKHIDAAIIPGPTNGKNPFEGRCKNTIFLDNYPIVDSRREYIERNKPATIHEVKVCYVGGLNEGRGITKLIKGCYQAGVKLILAGPFSPPEYKEQIFAMQESKCIDYRGICNYDEITKIYQESHIGAATLLKVGQYATMENLPTKTYEYMQVGLPILMSDTNYNLRLMKKDNFAYLVVPENEKNIADKIKCIYLHYDEAVKKAELAHKLVEKKYNWDKNSQSLVRLYRRLYYNL